MSSHSDDIFGKRSIWGIIWSCFSTLFACTWIAVHPNIPGPKDSLWVVLGRRIAIMGYVLITPEMVIFWAAKQHFGARRLAEHYRGLGWTMTHGFFLIMGGFTLHDERGTPLRILVPEELHELARAGKIDWPSITEEEIQDRSKGDCLSKAIVLVQTSWFIAQCIVRAVYRLDVTELEVATLAYAALTGVTYYLWWHKPLDVRCSVPVYMHPNKVHVATQTTMHEESETQFPVATPNPKSNPLELDSSPTTGTNFTPMQQFSAFIQSQRQEHGPFLGLIYAFLLAPLFTLFQAFEIENTRYNPHGSSPFRVPIFYAFHAQRDSKFCICVATCVAIIFGSIHCIAWSFHFPSLIERLVWRISAGFVSGFPIFWMASPFLLLYFPKYVGKSTKLGEFLIKFGGYTLPVLFVTARIALLVLPCITLRALPPAAFFDIQWDSFIPHIG